MTHFFFFIPTIVAGTINALAGGGGLITFPLLMLVVTPVTADATSALALFFAYPTAVWRTRICWQTPMARVSKTLSRCTSPGEAGARLPAITASILARWLATLTARTTRQTREQGMARAGPTLSKAM